MSRSRATPNPTWPSSFVYNYRIYDRHRRPVVNLAVLADERADWRPERFGWQRWGCEVGIRSLRG